MSDPRYDPAGYLAYLEHSGMSAERAFEQRWRCAPEAGDLPSHLTRARIGAGIDCTEPWPDNRDPHLGIKWQRFFPKSPSLNESECDA